MIVVSDTAPLSELAKIGRLELLQAIFDQVVIPEEVYEEVTTGVHPAIAQVKAARWIIVRSVANPQSVRNLQDETLLDLGECAAIVLAEELAAERLLLDDLDARRVAKARNLPIVDTLGVVVIAKSQGLIPSVKEIMDALINQGKWISQQVYNEVLEIAQEFS